MLKLGGNKNSCAPVALRIISGIDEDTVFQVCRSHGYNVNAPGMKGYEILDAAEDLGLTINTKNAVRWFGDDARKAPTAARFARMNANKVYIAMNYNHAYVIAYGELIDYNFRTKNRNKLRITGAYEVLDGYDANSIREIAKFCKEQIQPKRKKTYSDPTKFRLKINVRTVSELKKNLRQSSRADVDQIVRIYRKDPRIELDYYLHFVDARTLNYLKNKGRVSFEPVV